MAERRVRLRDVAERAGVSVGSASQAFGRPELVSDEVRDRVLAAADELGYPGPDPAARRLRTGRAGALGLIFAERLGYQFTDPAAPAFLRGVARGMQKAPLGLLLLPDSRYRDEAARTVREAAVDGFIVYSAPRNDPRVEAALARRLPAVTVDQPRDTPTPFVGIDDRAAARAAAVHLRELGHGRVGVLSFIRALDREGTLVLDMTIERLATRRDFAGRLRRQPRCRSGDAAADDGRAAARGKGAPRHGAATRCDRTSSRARKPAGPGHFADGAGRS